MAIIYIEINPINQLPQHWKYRIENASGQNAHEPPIAPKVTKGLAEDIAAASTELAVYGAPLYLTVRYNAVVPIWTTVINGIYTEAHLPTQSQVNQNAWPGASIIEATDRSTSFSDNGSKPSLLHPKVTQDIEDMIYSHINNPKSKLRQAAPTWQPGVLQEATDWVWNRGRDVVNDAFTKQDMSSRIKPTFDPSDWVITRPGEVPYPTSFPGDNKVIDNEQQGLEALFAEHKRFIQEVVRKLQTDLEPEHIPGTPEFDNKRTWLQAIKDMMSIVSDATGAVTDLGDLLLGGLDAVVDPAIISSLTNVFSELLDDILRLMGMTGTEPTNTAWADLLTCDDKTLSCIIKEYVDAQSGGGGGGGLSQTEWFAIFDKYFLDRDLTGSANGNYNVAEKTGVDLNFFRGVEPHDRPHISI